MSTYDDYGNVIEGSDDLSTANNLVTNPGFESSLGTEWTKKSAADYGSFSAVTDSAPGSFSGDKVLRIEPKRQTTAADGTAYCTFSKRRGAAYFLIRKGSSSDTCRGM